MALVNGLPSVMLSNVAALIKQKVDDKSAPLVEQFTQLLYGNISSLDLFNLGCGDSFNLSFSDLDKGRLGIYSLNGL